MNKANKSNLDLSLILPLTLLILEAVVIIVLVATGYEITQTLLILFILLGVYLIYQIGRQLVGRWRINQAVTKIKEGKALADAGQNLQALQLWKSLLYTLPEEQFSEVLQRMASAYKDENMQEAVQQVQAIQSASKDFFEMSRNLRKATQQDRRDWQAMAYELQKMIKALPEEPGQDLSDTIPEE